MIMRGLKLQMAIQLVAEERLTEIEIATRLNVSVGSLLKLNSHPVFTRRVEQERATLRLEHCVKGRVERPKSGFPARP
jgi:hypothetical protein